VPDASLEEAALACLAECTFWPNVAEVLKRCTHTKRGLSIEEAESAILAQHPEWADPLERSRAQLELNRRRAAFDRPQVALLE
jgi:hypothetical protein